MTCTNEFIKICILFSARISNETVIIIIVIDDNHMVINLREIT